MHSLRKLASGIAKREGKKSQARIGDIREIIRIICELEGEELVKDPTGNSSVLNLICDAACKHRDKLLKKAKGVKGGRK
jgi:hypothetical protein